MDFLTFARSGSELRSGTTTRMIDFAVASSDRVLLFFCGWDQIDNLSNGLDSGVYVIDGTPVMVDGTFQDALGETLTSPSDEYSAEVFAKCRERIRCNKQKYKQALDAIAKMETEFDFLPIFDHLKALVEITPEQTTAYANRKREMLIVRALNERGMCIDVLVLDADGVISVAAEDGPLSRAVAVIRSTPGMDAPQAAKPLFLSWRPQGCILEDPKIDLLEGSTADLASHFFTSTI